MTDSFSHFDDDGASRMVDVGQKQVTIRMARASAAVTMQAKTLSMVRDRKHQKGDVLEVARLAGIMAAKNTASMIPLCHPIGLESVTVDFDFPDQQTIHIQATVKVEAKTGVEMEALAAVSVAGLTIYDMCKSMDRGMSISTIQLEEKMGGRSGHYLRENSEE